MVALKAIREANASLSPTSPTAVFVGATSGIGLGTIEALLKHSKAPKLIIIGRSQSKFNSTLSRLQQLNPEATLTFIEAQVSLLKEVDRVCSIIISNQSSLDLLWLSQGGLATATGSLSSERINEDLAISYYSRLLFIQRLIHLLNRSPSPRILAVLSAGQEGTLKTSDLGLQDATGMGTFPLMKHNVTMTSLAMHELALTNAKIAFIHTNPGMVSSAVHNKWFESWTGNWAAVGWLANRILPPLFHLLGVTPEEAGEIGFYELTDQKFAAASGKNFIRLSEKAEELSESALLKKYEDDRMGSEVLKHTDEVAQKVLAR